MDSPTNTWIAPAVVAAAVSATVSLTTLWISGYRDRQDRQRKLFADAFAGCQKYKEFPFVVRRRQRGSAPERTRISGELSDVQRELNVYRAQLQVEASRIGARYDLLVDAVRRVAGAEISRSWDMPARNRDDRMHVRDIDLSEIDSFESAFLIEVRDHLSLIPAIARRAFRVVRRWLVGLPRRSWFGV